MHQKNQYGGRGIHMYMALGKYSICSCGLMKLSIFQEGMCFQWVIIGGGIGARLGNTFIVSGASFSISTGQKAVTVSVAASYFSRY